MRATLVLLLLLLIPVLGGCLGSDVPVVEDFHGGSAAPVAIAAWEVDGARDGARTRAEVVIDLEDGRRLELDLLLAYDPEPILARGSWRGAGEAGPIEARAVRFVGGQGEGPSIGGDYDLLRGDDLAYRVRIPLSKIDPAAPNF